jgi:EH domain-containing protein 1
MNRDQYMNILRTELLEIVKKRLTPSAIKYGYSEVPLEANIKWRPLVLVIGNYSSGKSAMINEFLGAEIQKTGQAPTDDSFTVLTFEKSDNRPISTIETRDGMSLLSDSKYPFEMLKKHGQRFASHFRLKKINSPFLESLTIIDTPGMLDSITERDRGYNYQQVIGDLAQIADLILILFDPHKAGTVRETHISLREILPVRTFEDRVFFVLNRIDECSSLTDLLRVYGTLCWNLSQITGRKDIPMIHLTYSKTAAQDSKTISNNYLKYLDNQREELKRSVLDAPRHRLDNLVSFVENHSERLSHYLEGLVNYRKKFIKYRLKLLAYGLLTSLIFGAAADVAALSYKILPRDPKLLSIAGGSVSLLIFIFWILVVMKRRVLRFHKKSMENIDDLTVLRTQNRRDTWNAVKDSVLNYLKKTSGKYSYTDIKNCYETAASYFNTGTTDMREAISELSSVMPGEPINPADLNPYLASIAEDYENEDDDDYEEKAVEYEEEKRQIEQLK